jgi:hypothetical protein
VKRLLWLGVGLAVGALVVRAVTKKAQSLTPGGLADSLRQSGGGLADSVRDFVEDVREGMADREYEIRSSFAEGVALDDDQDQSWARGVGGFFYREGDPRQ